MGFILAAIALVKVGKLIVPGVSGERILFWSAVAGVVVCIGVIMVTVLRDRRSRQDLLLRLRLLLTRSRRKITQRRTPKPKGFYSESDRELR